MSKSLRLSEKWFNRGLWLVSIIFASFLIGLGSTIVSDLPQVESHKTIEDFIDQEKAKPLELEINKLTEIEKIAEEKISQIELKLTTAQQINSSAQEIFANWISTRKATEQVDQNQELIKRTKELDMLNATMNEIQATLSIQKKILLDTKQQHDKLQAQLYLLSNEASILYNAEQQRLQLRVFGYRLALTLPLLVISGWLFIKKRKEKYWPFIWGFIFFALFTFFIELVPYLPSYGGYVRYIVGIIITVVIGRHIINALNIYITKQKLSEKQPEILRRKELSYESALICFSKGSCPGCERKIDLKNNLLDFCPHCGINLFNYCAKCNTRKNAFSKFCHCCGDSAELQAREDS